MKRNYVAQWSLAARSHAGSADRGEGSANKGLGKPMSDRTQPADFTELLLEAMLR